LPAPKARDLTELALAFALSFAAVYLVNTPAYHYVSWALVVYLGLLVGIPVVSSVARGVNPLYDYGLKGTTSLRPAYFLAVLLLPLVLIPLLWNYSYSFTVAFAVVVAPFCEELFFRGYMAGRLASMGVVSASVISALAFGAFHLGAQQFQNPTAIVVLVLLGLVYGPVYLLTKSVYVTAAAHSAWNLFAYLILASPSTPLSYFSYVALGVIMGADIFLVLVEIASAQQLASAPPE